VVNLYPFEETIAKPDVTLEAAVENIDIGGPTMIRAAAKNWQDVAVVIDPTDYQKILEEVKSAGQISCETKFRLAKKVFIHTARYEGTIANYLTGGKDGQFPEAFHYQGIKVQDLRYGENPHQKALFYKDSVPDGTGQESCVANAKQLHGKELSYNNIIDLDAAIELVKEFKEPACIIIKHTNPCGVSMGSKALKDIFMAARECDPTSAFGGIIGINRVVDADTAREIAKDFYECVVAPGFEPDAFQILTSKKTIRLMELTDLKTVVGSSIAPLWEMKKVGGGLLVQERDRLVENIRSAKVVTKRSPTQNEWQSLEFAWKVCKHVKSNAIVFASSEASPRILGIGCGQVSRVDATKFGIQKSRSSLKGAVMASDAFFPFRDNIDEAARAGVKAIIQPGGSIRDEESIQAADEQGIAMVFTGVRHFRH